MRLENTGGFIIYCNLKTRCCSYLTILTSFLSATSQTCTPVTAKDEKGEKGSPWIVNDIGCWTSFVAEDKSEVHIFKLNFDNPVSMSKLFEFNADYLSQI